MRYLLDWKHPRTTMGEWRRLGSRPIAVGGAATHGYHTLDSLLAAVGRISLLGDEPVKRAVILANLRAGHEVKVKNEYTLKIIEVPDDPK